MKILIADDNSLTRTRVEAAAAKWGFEAVVVADGLQTWDVLRAEDSPRLAILDWNMPGLAGTEICRRLRASGAGPYTYVILLTSHGEQEKLVEGLRAGADDFVRKPFNASELEQRVRTGQRIVELQDRLLETQEKLRIQATRDSLTGLWNRAEILRILDEQVTRSIRDLRPLGVMLIDVDHFKSVNDTFGHLAGDEILRHVTFLIATEVRNFGHIGRFGGEEFLVILPGADRETSAQVGERVRRCVDETIDRAGHPSRKVTISVGVACVGVNTNQTMRETVQQCDDALYKAKRLGRNRVCVAETAFESAEACR